MSSDFFMMNFRKHAGISLMISIGAETVDFFPMELME